MTYLTSHHSHTDDRLRHSGIHLGMSCDDVHPTFCTYARKLSEQFLHSAFIIIWHDDGIRCHPRHIATDPYTVVKTGYIKPQSHISAVDTHSSGSIHAFAFCRTRIFAICISCLTCIFSAIPITQQEPGIVFSYSGSRYVIMDSMWQTLKY